MSKSGKPVISWEKFISGQLFISKTIIPNFLESKISTPPIVKWGSIAAHAFSANEKYYYFLSESIFDSILKSSLNPFDLKSY